MRVIASILILLSVGCVASSPSIARAETKPKEPANILFILTDQHRRDCVGAYGNPKIHTPNLDRLARDGVRFDRAYVSQPVCSPCRSSIMTGLYPHTSGVWENKVPLPKSSKTIAEMLAPAGYDCGYFGKWHLVRRDAFETFPEYPNDGRGSNHYFGKGDSKRYGIDVITADAIQFVKKKRSKPFCTFVSFYPPHPPYSAPPGYEDRYKEIQDPKKRIYYAMCTKIDEKVGELLGVLKEMGISDKTLVVFTTEHGHHFERLWNNHDKRLCYDTASRIPLLMRLGGVLPAGRTTDGFVSSVDLVPTMLSLIGQPIPAGLEGSDLSDLARGKTERGREFVFMENIPYPFNRAKGEERCVRDDRWKLILSTVRDPELYDMTADPQERTNLWKERQGTPAADRLIRALADWAKRTRDPLAPKLLKRVTP